MWLIFHRPKTHLSRAGVRACKAYLDKSPPTTICVVCSPVLFSIAIFFSSNLVCLTASLCPPASPQHRRSIIVYLTSFLLRSSVDPKRLRIRLQNHLSSLASEHRSHGARVGGRGSELILRWLSRPERPHEDLVHLREVQRRRIVHQLVRLLDQSHAMWCGSIAARCNEQKRRPLEEEMEISTHPEEATCEPFCFPLRVSPWFATRHRL